VANGSGEMFQAGMCIHTSTSTKTEQHSSRTFQIGTLACFIDVPSSHFATFEFHRSLVGPRTPGRSHVADLEGVPQVEQTAYRLIESQTFGLRRSRCAGHHFWRIIACYFHHETKPVGGLKAKVESFVAYSKYRVAKCSRLFCP
jgi:hypothetical protein